MPAPESLDPGTVIGKCSVVKELGRGGMGAVYLARHTTLGVDVALKVLTAQVARQSPQFADRFLREARVAAALKHPNVVAVMDADVDVATGLRYIVQEYVDGGSLAARVRKGPLPEKQALAAAAGVLKALQEAAKQRIVHRDIKPDNVLVTKDGRVKLADLGLAKRSDEASELTRTTATMGTPQYMSPEQIEDTRTVDVRSDMYSVGATLYHLLTGRPPFEGTEVYAVLHKVMTAPVPDPRAARPEISEGAARFCMKLMAKKAEERYQTPSEALADLARGGPPADELELAPAPVSAGNAAATPTIGAPSGAPPSAPVARSVDIASVPPSQADGGGSMTKAVWALVGCCALLLILGVRMMMKTKEPLAPAATPDAGGGGTASSSAPPPVDPPPHPTPATTLHNGCVLALSFEPETALEQEGHRGWKNVAQDRVMAIGVKILDVDGRVGQAAHFDGRESYLSLPPFSQRTVAAWLKPAEARQMVWYDGGSETRLRGFCAGLARLGRSEGVLEMDAAWVNFIGASVGVPAKGAFDGWHHVAVAWDGGKSVRIAVDGQMPDGLVLDRRPGPGARRPQPVKQPMTLSETPSPAAETTVVGRSKMASNPLFPAFAGAMDEVAAWDRALTDDELTSLAGFAEKGRSYVEAIQEARESEK